MTLVANRVSAASARRRVVRGYLDASTEWEEYCNGYLRVHELHAGSSDQKPEA